MYTSFGFVIMFLTDRKPEVDQWAQTYWQVENWNRMANGNCNNMRLFSDHTVKHGYKRHNHIININPFNILPIFSIFRAYVISVENLKKLSSLQFSELHHKRGTKP